MSKKLDQSDGGYFLPAKADRKCTQQVSRKRIITSVSLNDNSDTKTFGGELSILSRLHTMGQNLQRNVKTVRGHRIDTTKPIGSGTFATVYLAVDRDENRRVAKHVEIVNDDRMARVVTELKKISHLNHGNVVRIMEIYQKRDFLWTFTEYLRHKDLDSYLHQRKASPLPLRGKMQIMSDIAEGLKFLHRKKIVHTDIKPASILVKGIPKNAYNTSSRTVVAKISASGTSRCTKQNAFADEVNSSSFNFKPPEFFRKEAMKSSADIYELGLLCLAMLQGHDPLKPQLEDFENDSDSHKPIGEFVAQKLRRSLEPPEIIVLKPERDAIRETEVMIRSRRLVASLLLPPGTLGLDGTALAYPARGTMALEEDRVTIRTQEIEDQASGGKPPTTHQNVRQMIQKMTRPQPSDRLTAADVAKILQDLVCI